MWMVNEVDLSLNYEKKCLEEADLKQVEQKQSNILNT